MILASVACASVSTEQPTGSENESTQRVLPGSNSSNYEMLINTIKAVVFVAVFGTAAIFVLKKLAPKISNPTGKNIHVLENVSLGQRRALHLVEVRGRQILIGSSADSIVKLCELSEDKKATDCEVRDD